MEIALIVISIVCIALIGYLIGIKLQLRNIRRQLERRQQEQAEGLIMLELQEPELKKMTVTLNQTLKQETVKPNTKRN